jgi:hypothetical protein
MMGTVKNTIILVGLVTALALQAQTPDTNVYIIKAWDYDMRTGVRDLAQMDTGIFDVARYSPLLSNSFSNIYLGNMGTAARSNVYHDLSHSDFVFGKGYAPYDWDQKTFTIYKAKQPVTLASFTLGDEKEQEERTLRLLHTQNVNRYTNLGFRYRSIQSIGQYPRQRVGMNNISVFGSYEKDNVKVMASANRNLYKYEENGGINDSLWDNTELAPQTRYEGVFQNANTVYRNQNLNFLTEYSLIDFGKEADTLGPEAEGRSSSLILGQMTTIGQYLRNFNANTGPGARILRQMAQIDSAHTNDSAYFREINNRIFFKLKTGNQYITGGIQNEFLKYIHRQVPDTIFYVNDGPNGKVSVFNHEGIIKNNSEKQYGFSLFGDIEINISDVLNLKFIGKYYLFGYQRFNTDLTGKATVNLKKWDMAASTGLKTRKPDYFYNRYIANFYEWNNSFDNTRTWNTEAIVKSKEKNTGVRVNYTLLGNYVYFNDNSVPAQYNTPFGVSAIQVYGEFDFWKFKTLNEMSFQRSGNMDVLPLPGMAMFHSLSFNQTLFAKALHFNLGYDLYYYSKYKAYAYEPILGVFHTQDRQQTGNYPFVDLYLNFKVKRTLFYFKYEHVNQLVNPLNDNNNQILYGRSYYTTANYINPGRVLRFGITWMFLN